MQVRRAAAPLLIVLVAVGCTALVAAVPSLRLRLESPAADAVAIVALGIAELAVALLAAQRFRRTASRADFGIAVGIGVMAVVDVVLPLGRATLAQEGVSAGTAAAFHVAGACVLAVAAIAPSGPLVRRPRRRLGVASVAVVALGMFALQRTGLIPGLRPAPGGGALGVDLLRVVAFALLTVAAAGLAGRRDRRADPLLRWLSAALALAALTQIERVAIAAPSAQAFTWVHVLQLAAAAAMLVACAEEVRAYHRGIAEVAVTDERRRMARELHDGLAQEVAYVASQTKHLAAHSEDERLQLIAAAAERALDDSRYVVGALRRASGQPLSASIALQAQEFARRWGLTVELALQPEVDVAPEKEEAILRIVGEALSNAARHAHAHTVNIRLGDVDGSVRVAVSDDGDGFDADAKPFAERGFGLRSMRERAQLVGGDVHLESHPGAGTRVDIAIP
jgi:signal transduction histidine kinase